ncbi:hypothetical protein HDU87_003192 [Geranomyces variabilis]|uniref:Uncharacterized protein n=1 Tax=Geranomyces variabilis TaxID=109894 RepID=A0AAD5XSS1_9FUNG|nr:hypothetical protein HDU87_003192 [Geranomyces variabilis]
MPPKRPRTETLQTSEASDTHALQVVRASSRLSAEQKASLTSFEEVFSSPLGSYLLIELLSTCNISVALLQKARDICIDKSFSECKYADMAPLFGLDPNAGGLDITPLVPLHCRIPLAVWKTILEGVDQVEDEIGTVSLHVNENTRSQWIAAWFRPLVALFRSRIRKMPERTMLGHRTKGGRIELQYWLHAQCLLVVIEVKFSLSDNIAAQDALAQLFAELDAADFRNRKETLAVPTVRGVLTDGTRFRFVDYNSGTISQSDVYSVDTNNYQATAATMKPICEIFFASLLEGWKHGLEAYRARLLTQELTGARRASATEWQAACIAAVEALKLASEMNPADKDRQAKDVIALIEQSVTVVQKARLAGFYRETSAYSTD